ncbi:hypothetical protein MCOR27_011459 [Pyricularia oryzae]|uniref:Uncharacterized protein n=1 Tax=Pyricularia grisea TaxID=148305 RepID=A0ABQ8N239_PYRGI|nr:hypothetical protein MCOR01_004486 [Pyricularia oryzae]KAI6289942.1 hypothetical protein MCOR33_011625 [Pyricularia grisea]KAI6251761.1 hypothetical protein MCOR19_011606 [Pyricularia oryzae]KAI6265285.1 hypothetical protein MCOR27_011459 [Pyricularia oryzae]KAI6306385.1 hypothetical protein MCOR29_010147 [Pyricularia oryzae]
MTNQVNLEDWAEGLAVILEQARDAMPATQDFHGYGTANMLIGEISKAETQPPAKAPEHHPLPGSRPGPSRSRYSSSTTSSPHLSWSKWPDLSRPRSNPFSSRALFVVSPLSGILVPREMIALESSPAQPKNREQNQSEGRPDDNVDYLDDDDLYNDLDDEWFGELDDKRPQAASPPSSDPAELPFPSPQEAYPDFFGPSPPVLDGLLHPVTSLLLASTTRTKSRPCP